MRSVNRFTILGNVGKVHTFDRVTKVSIATNRVWTDDSGQRNERTDWVQLTILDEGQAQWVAENVQSGDAVFAEGRISQNSYGSGEDRKFSTDLIVQVFNLLNS